MIDFSLFREMLMVSYSFKMASTFLFFVSAFVDAEGDLISIFNEDDFELFNKSGVNRVDVYVPNDD